MWVCIFEALLDCSALNMGVAKGFKSIHIRDSVGIRRNIFHCKGLHLKCLDSLVPDVWNLCYRYWNRVAVSTSLPFHVCLSLSLSLLHTNTYTPWNFNWLLIKLSGPRLFEANCFDRDMISNAKSTVYWQLYFTLAICVCVYVSVDGSKWLSVTFYLTQKADQKLLLILQGDATSTRRTNVKCTDIRSSQFTFVKYLSNLCMGGFPLN